MTDSHPDPVAGERCTFRPVRAVGRAKGLVQDKAGKRWAVVLSLCVVHWQTLASAGERGRVHGPTKIHHRLTPGQTI